MAVLLVFDISFFPLNHDNRLQVKLHKIALTCMHITRSIVSRQVESIRAESYS